ncbi:MAG: 16S rRNA (uracil(1498)-N(3))-methyltransferase [Clostridia bacterium]|nr:16S rRNA (uracil(1498)-N(3))-methyltransferase [Clostridia bacterium]
MPKFFISPEQATGSSVLMTGEDARHIAASLRMEEGERLTLCDGAGIDLLCRIERVGKTEVALSVLERRPSEGESACRITLFQCLPKGDKMESIVQKSVELGVASIVPVLSSRCISRPDAAGMEKKRRRWQLIAQEAAKQSRRGVIPVVEEMLRFEDAVVRLSAMEYGLLLYEKQQGSGISQIPANAAEIGVLVGPEGGISPEEAEKCRAMGLLSIGLGPRILRTETAGSAAIAVLQYQTGNLE